MEKVVAAGPPESVPPEDVLRRIRIPFVHRATLTHRGKSRDVFIMDIGLTGVFIEQDDLLPVGEGVVVRFVLPGNELPVVARCRVAWRHAPGEALSSKDLPPGMGLEFVEVSETDSRRIRERVVAHCLQPARARRFLRHWPEAERKGDDP